MSKRPASDIQEANDEAEEDDAKRQRGVGESSGSTDAFDAVAGSIQPPSRESSRAALCDFVRDVARENISRFVQDLANLGSTVPGLDLSHLHEQDIMPAVSSSIENAAAGLAEYVSRSGSMAKVCLATLSALGGAAYLAREREIENILRHFGARMEKACQEGDADTVGILLELGESRNRVFSSREIVIWINKARLLGGAGGGPAVISRLFDLLKPAKYENLAIRLAAKFGNADLVRELRGLSEVDPGAADNAAIILAAECGHTDIVRLLLQDPRVDPSARSDCALRWGAQVGEVDIVNLLLADSRVNPAGNNNFAIRQAAARGHLNVVERLLLRTEVDPSVNDNRAIRLASANGHSGVVRRLLADPRVDPTSRDNNPLRRACFREHIDVIKILLDCSRVDPNHTASGEEAPLTVAAKRGDIEVVRTLLLNSRVNPAISGNAPLLGALSEGNVDVARILLRRSEVLSAVRDQRLPQEQLTEIMRIYGEMTAGCSSAVQRALAWHRAMKHGGEDTARELSTRADLVGKILGMAFGSELVLPRTEGDGTYPDARTQIRSERLICKLVR